DAVRTGESALLIKRDRQRAVPCADLQDGIPPLIGRGNKVEHRLSVPLAPPFRRRCNVLDLKDTAALVVHHTVALASLIAQYLQGPSVQRPVDHVLLLIPRQQQRKVLFFVLPHSSDLHVASSPRSVFPGAIPSSAALPAATGVPPTV